MGYLIKFLFLCNFIVKKFLLEKINFKKRKGYLFMKEDLK